MEKAIFIIIQVFGVMIYEILKLLIISAYPVLMGLDVYFYPDTYAAST